MPDGKILLVSGNQLNDQFGEEEVLAAESHLPCSTNLAEQHDLFWLFLRILVSFINSMFYPMWFDTRNDQQSGSIWYGLGLTAVLPTNSY